VSRANIIIEGDFASPGKESASVEFLEGGTSTAHLTTLGSMSLPDTSMAGDFESQLRRVFDALFIYFREGSADPSGEASCVRTGSGSRETV